MQPSAGLLYQVTGPDALSALAFCRRDGLFLFSGGAEDAGNGFLLPAPQVPTRGTRW